MKHDRRTAPAKQDSYIGQRVRPVYVDDVGRPPRCLDVSAHQRLRPEHAVGRKPDYLHALQPDFGLEGSAPALPPRTGRTNHTYLVTARRYTLSNCGHRVLQPAGIGRIELAEVENSQLEKIVLTSMRAADRASAGCASSSKRLRSSNSDFFPSLLLR